MNVNRNALQAPQAEFSADSIKTPDFQAAIAALSDEERTNAIYALLYGRNHKQLQLASNLLHRLRNDLLHRWKVKTPEDQKKHYEAGFPF